jgi:chromosome segregation ATPase
MAGSPRNGRQVKVNRGPQNKLENDLKRVKALARTVRQRHGKEQSDLTSRLRELCVIVMQLNDVNDSEIAEFKSYEKWISKIEQHKQTFVDYDDNLTGKISWDEFLKAAEFLDIRGSPGQLKRQFDKFDSNRDQTIAEREFIKCLLPDVNTDDLLPLAQISILRKYLSGLRGSHDRRRRAYDKLDDENESLRAQLQKTKEELDRARMEPRTKAEDFLNWEPEDTGLSAHYEELEQKEKELRQ